MSFSRGGPSEGEDGHYTSPSEREDDIPLVRVGKLFFMFWVTWTCRQFRLVRTYASREGDMLWGHVPRGGLTWTYASREGDMSWCIMVYDYGIG
jgi:hypothetical protein